jgi:hypothetical protein
MTRLALSPARMWADLLAPTGVDAAALLRAVARRLEDVAGRLERGVGVADLMTRTRAWRAGTAPQGGEDGGR